MVIESGQVLEKGFLVLAQILSLFRYFPRPFSGTCPDSIPSLVLAQIRSPFSSTRPDSSSTCPDSITFMVLTQIRSLFRYSPGFFWYLPKFDPFSSTFPNFIILFQYLLRFFGTFLDSITFLVLVQKNPGEYQKSDRTGASTIKVIKSGQVLESRRVEEKGDQIWESTREGSRQVLE